MLKSFSLFLIIIASFNFSVFGQDSVEVTVDKNSLETGEVFTYKVTIKGEFSNPQLILPSFKDFNIISQSEAKSYSFKKNKLLLEIKLDYKLIAPKPGLFIIDKVVVKDGASKFEGRAVTLEVKGKPLEEKEKIKDYLDKATSI